MQQDNLQQPSGRAQQEGLMQQDNLQQPRGRAQQEGRMHADNLQQTQGGRVQQEGRMQQPRGRMQQQDSQEPRGRVQQEDSQEPRGRVQQSSMQRHAQPEAAWQARYGSHPNAGAISNVDGLPSVGPHNMYMRHTTAGDVNEQHDVVNTSANRVSHVHDGMMMHAPQATPQVAPRMGASKAMVSPTVYESVAPRGGPATKLRSGGSRVASSARTAEGGNVLTVENEDAFAVGSCCFAVGDGMQQVDTSGTIINSGPFAHELVSAAVLIAAGSIQEFVQGRSNGPVDPKAVLQQAAHSTQASGAAAIMLGSLNPVTSILSISKMGDCGFVVLRPHGDGDLEVRSHSSFYCRQSWFLPGSRTSARSQTERNLVDRSSRPYATNLLLYIVCRLLYLDFCL